MDEDRQGQKEKLLSILEPAVEAAGMEIVEIELLGSARRGTLRVFIDKPGGVNISDCAKISRSINAILDIEDPFSGSYTLEVSSPGINRPLTKPGHFERHIGEKVRVETRRPIEGNQRKYIGILKVFDEETPSITIETEQKNLIINLDDIQKARIDAPLEVIPSQKGKRRKS